MGWLFHLYRKEKIFECNTSHFMFEKHNNPDVNPNIPLKDQNPYILERIIKSVKRKNLGLYASAEAAQNGLTFLK